MSLPINNAHISKLCCFVQSVGKFKDKDICKQCLKDIVKRTGLKEDAFKDILEVLNEFTLHDKT